MKIGSGVPELRGIENRPRLLTRLMAYTTACNTVIGLRRQLAKTHNPSTSINTTQSARNLGFIFDEHLSFSDQISALSKFCYHHIRALRCIRPYLGLHTAKTIATSIVHSKLYYCNSLYYGLPKYQINRLQHIQNSLARIVVQAPKFQHITPILKSLHWLSFWTDWI